MTYVTFISLLKLSYRIPNFLTILYIYILSGLTAIEAWMLACILFVFGALVEYAVILFRRQTSSDNVDRPTEVRIMPIHNYSRVYSKMIENSEVKGSHHSR